MGQNDFLIYVEALNPAKGLVIVDERIPSRTLHKPSSSRWKKKSCILTSSPTLSRGLTKASNSESKERNCIFVSART